MSVTVSVDDEAVRVTDEEFERRPPDRASFAVAGVVTPTESLVGEFEGTTAEPTRVELSGADSRTVAIDLEEASLRLETVDVGVETPGADDISREDTRLPGSETAESTDGGPGSIAFTVEGAIEDVPEETLESVPDESATVQSITFAVDDTAKRDGGPPDDVVLEFALFGYGIVVRRSGAIEIGSRGGGADSGLV